MENSNFVKTIVHMVVGFFTYPGLAIFNRLRFSGTEHLKNLPPNNVLFVSNHQTYFLDVIALYHIFAAVKWGKKKRLGIPYYLLSPFIHVNFVGAEKTLKKNWMTKFFLLAGGITVKRTWNESAGEKRTSLDPSDTRKIQRAMQNNWVITFPQGTTTPFAPARNGTALIVKNYKPIIIPVVISGFSDAFNKTGIGVKKMGRKLHIQFKAPLQYDINDSLQEMTNQMMEAIEQSKRGKPNDAQAS